eukprot:jgi/Mesvir1/17907/Mv12973-RA.1
MYLLWSVETGKDPDLVAILSDNSLGVATPISARKPSRQELVTEKPEDSSIRQRLASSSTSEQATERSSPGGRRPSAAPVPRAGGQGAGMSRFGGEADSEWRALEGGPAGSRASDFVRDGSTSEAAETSNRNAGDAGNSATSAAEWVPNSAFTSAAGGADSALVVGLSPRLAKLGLDDLSYVSSPGGQCASPKAGPWGRHLVEGVSYPVVPAWNKQRPYLTGDSIFLSGGKAAPAATAKGAGAGKQPELRRIGTYPPAVQELIIIDDILFTMMGIEGKYIKASRRIEPGVVAGAGGKNKPGGTTLPMVRFDVDDTLNTSLREMAARLLPLCSYQLQVARFVETRSRFEHGLVSQALAAALGSLLADFGILVTQLEHQFRLGKLSLQGLWFYCQPALGAMKLLAGTCAKASARRLTGASLLNLLNKEATGMGGDTSARDLLHRLLAAACAPYFSILERWVYTGVVDDPYGEFMIEERRELAKESLTEDYNAEYWQSRYALGRREVPVFLRGSAEGILTTGKYLNAIRECGSAVEYPYARQAPILFNPWDRGYLARVDDAFRFASGELLRRLFHDAALMPRLRSLKHYFLADQGDLLVLFMDMAGPELAKPAAEISLTKLQSLLELSFRTSTACQDAYHEEFTCSLERAPLITQLLSIININDDVTDLTSGISMDAGGGGPPMTPVTPKTAWGADAATPPFPLSPLTVAGDGSARRGSLAPRGHAARRMTGLETFTLDYNAKWPVSLVLSRKALAKYQLIFRYLLHCKHVERQLSDTWHLHQRMRCLGVAAAAFLPAFCLCQRMLHFLLNFEHYMTFEVLEPNWHVMDEKMRASVTVDEVISRHDDFLDRCLKECMLFWPKILRRLERIKFTCLLFCSATREALGPLEPADAYSDDITAVQHAGGAPLSGAEATRARRRRRERERQQAARVLENSAFLTSVKKLERSFNQQLQELVAVLNTSTHREPHLAHLAHRLSGVGQGLI